MVRAVVPQIIPYEKERVFLLLQHHQPMWTALVPDISYLCLKKIILSVFLAFLPTKKK